MKNKLFLIRQITVTLTSILLLVFLVSACHSNNTNSNQPKTLADSLNDQLLSLHEKAMDKIGILRTLKDSLNKTDSASGKLGNKNLQPVIEKLNSADTAMFAWMQKESSDTITRTGDERIDHLKAELQQVSAINKQMDSAINEARGQ